MRKRKLKLEPERETVFPASQLTPLGVKWKELTAAKRHKEAMAVLEQIIKGCTPMFERLAMHENFHHTVDLKWLVRAAQDKVVRWLLAWDPKRGRLFSFFSRCSKNAFLSEIGKITTYRNKYYSTSDSLELIHGAEDHAVDKHDLTREVNNRINELTCRWGDPQEIGAIRFIIQCLVDDDARRDKRSVIWSAAYAWGISPDLSKHFYDWAITELRHQFYYKIHVPFTEQDLLVAEHSYSWIADCVNLIGYENTKKFIVVYQGKRLPVPTLASLQRFKENVEICEEMDKTDLTPEAMAAVARKHGRPERSAQDIYRETIEKLDSNRYGEHEIFEDQAAGTVQH